MELQVGVKILLRNSSGKFLLIRRSPLKYPEVGSKWDLVGGRIKAGIPLLMNLKREIREETGLKLLKVEKLLAVQDILRIKGRHVVRISYLGKAKGKIKLDKDENFEYGWFTFNEIKKLPKRTVDMYFLKILKDIK